MDVILTPLTNFETVLRHAKAMDIVSEEEFEVIEKWQTNPSKWKK